jgi:aminoglycoside phosphotransferase family enzyme/predicted kinase
MTWPQAGPRILLSDYAQIIAGLALPAAYPHPADRFAHIETHASHVFLVGDLAYKLKKPVNLGFLDFTTLERRRFFCEEELRLNRRLAPDTYLAVVPITGTPAAPRMGGEGEAIEFAVKMRRFPQNALLSRRRVTPDIVDRIADRVAAFHEVIPIAAPESGYGSPESVLAPMLENLVVLRKGATGDLEAPRLAALEAWTRARFPDLRELIERRRLDGRVRECHGDLHRGNIAEVSGQLIIFDGIEFDPALRWIDTVNEVAFLAMDLAQGDAPDLGRRFLNRYLERNGDYDGVALLDLYRVYRATVRAKVTAIRLTQAGLEANEVLHYRRERARYLALAEDYTSDHPRRLILTHGRSGSGKTHLSVVLRERLRVIHIRSDIERKRLFGLPPEARVAAAAETGIYTPDATARTYARLLDLARTILAGGWGVLVDATFLRRSQRAPFLALAAELRVPCTVLCLQAPESVLRARVAKRVAEGCDASDADVTILDAQSAVHEALTQEESACAIPVHTHPAPDLDDLLRRFRD